MAVLVDQELSEEDCDAAVLSEWRKRSAPSPATSSETDVGRSPEAKKTKSVAWVYHFFRATEEPNKYQCLFPNCQGHTYTAPTTSNLLSHLRRHSMAYHTISDYLKQGLEPDASIAASLIKNEMRGVVSIPTLLSSAATKSVTHAIQLLSWIIIDAKPFSIADDPRFREFMAGFGYQPPSSRQLLRYMGPLQDMVNTIIHSKFAKMEFVSVAVDEWTSANLVSFLSLSYQGFDNEMQLIQCEDLIRFPPPHDAASYKEHIRRRLDFRTSKDILLTSLTADGARAIQNACREIVGDTDSIWCLAHQLQLAVNDVLQATANPYQIPIAKVRQWVLAIRTHLIPKAALAEREQLANVKEQQLVLDVATRWDSALLMITVFLKLWPLISSLANDGVLDEFVAGNQDITNEEIAQLRAASSVLQHFARVTHAAGAKYATIVYVPAMIEQLLRCLDIRPGEDTTLVAQFKDLLRAALVARMEPIMEHPSPQILAALLDPLQHNLPFIKGNDALVKAVNEEMVKQIVLLNTERTLPTGEVIAATTMEQARTELQEYHSLCTLNAEAFQKLLHSEVPWSEEALTKLCLWWVGHREYRRLFRTARALLAVHATSTNNERAFSAAGEQNAIKRRGMSPETLESVCLIAGNIDDSMTLDELVALTRKVAKEKSERDPFYPQDEPDE